jgi:hypothetical protein
MAFQSFGPLSNAPDPVTTTADDIAKRIYRDDAIPAIRNVAERIIRREDAAECPVNRNSSRCPKKFSVRFFSGQRPNREPSFRDPTPYSRRTN